MLKLTDIFGSICTWVILKCAIDLSKSSPLPQCNVFWIRLTHSQYHRFLLLLLFYLQHSSIACFLCTLIIFAFNIPHQAHSQTSVCKRFAFNFCFIVKQLKIYAFEGYGPHLQEKNLFSFKKSFTSIVRPFIIVLSFCTKNGIIKLLFSVGYD